LQTHRITDAGSYNTPGLYVDLSVRTKILFPVENVEPMLTLEFTKKGNNVVSRRDNDDTRNLVTGSLPLVAREPKEQESGVLQALVEAPCRPRKEIEAIIFTRTIIMR
jgi:hypothetical protein